MVDNVRPTLLHKASPLDIANCLMEDFEIVGIYNFSFDIYFTNLNQTADNIRLTYGVSN